MFLDDLFDFGVIEKDLLKKVDDYMYQFSKECADKEKTIWDERRKDLEWTFEEWEHPKEFDEKYDGAKDKKYWILKNNKRNTYFSLFSLNSQRTQKEMEEMLNKQRYVELWKYFEDKTSDKIMEECYGKNWKTTNQYGGKPVSPYHLYPHSVIFDTHTGEIIYSTPEESFNHAYIYFYDNIVEIIQDQKDTVYFDLPNRKIIAEGHYDKIETNDFIILGKSKYYGQKDKKTAKAINKHTCEVSELN